MHSILIIAYFLNLSSSFFYNQDFYYFLPMQKAFFFQSFCTPYRNCRFVSTAQRQDFHPASSMETENLNFKPFLPLKCMNKVEIIYTRIPLTTSILLTLHFFCFSTIPSLRFHNKKSHNMYVLHFVFLFDTYKFFPLLSVFSP